MRSQWMSGIGGMLMASAALLWFVDPAGAIQLESWDNKIPNANARFKVLSEFEGQAVLDKETQLVWEQAQATSFHDWNAARLVCTSRTTGGRKGWRLPSVHELASLVDPANSDPSLPTGHPFTIISVQSSNSWSASADAGDPARAWFVDFLGGGVFAGVKTFPLRAWCVRGGMNADAY